MKVLFISEVDLDGKSGQNIATKEIVTAFAKNNNIELTLVCPEPVIGFEPTIKEIKNKWYLPKRKKRNLVWHIKQQFYMLKIIRQIIRIQKPDYIIARLGTSTFIPPIIARLYNLNYILLVRGLPNFRKVGKIPGMNLYGRVLFSINSKIAKNIYVAYAEIKRYVDRFRKSSQNKSIILTNAVDIKKFYPMDIPTARRKSGLAFDIDDFVIGFAGSIKERHCLRELILAIKKLNNNKLNVKCLIIGEGPQLDFLQKLTEELNISDNVVFTGFIPHTDLNSYLSSCNILYGAIHSKMVENPIKNYEYLACGRPIITTVKKEMEFIEKEEIGILLNENTPTEIGNAIETIYNTPEKDILKMRKKSRDYIIEHHTWSKFVDSILGGKNYE